MYEIDLALRKIAGLVKDFQRNQSHYKSPKYSEAEARKDFIDKFWIALGWDVNHDRQTNPYEQEVKVERAVAVGATQRRADYAFYLAPNFHDVQFLVEAKKPFVDIETKENYFQLIRYGWNSETPLAVLMDFEQLHILDCRYRPDIETALSRRIGKYHYTDYTKCEKFSEIYWLFSREAVADGSIEKRAKELPKPRGKAIQRGLFPGGYRSIDESFLAELDGYRSTLARSLKNKNPKFDGETLTELAQRTLDRLVFLRFLEDKGIQPERHVERFGEKATAWEDFIAATRRLDRIYNGIVYKRHDILDGTTLRVDNTTFANICEDLSHINSPNDFNAIPIHILGSIYERFLGKVIVTTAKRAKVEEKPEVRKAGGVYYTPEYIVRYIVENTVGKLIAGKTPTQIAKMRFADIACGSGSFLLGVFDLLLKYHGQYYNDNPGKAKKGDCVKRDGRLFLSLRKKREILLNNIYGVDIDSQAVEVCQLSLYLKLLEEETEASTRQYLLDFEHTAQMKQLLPDLSKNIVCGNSLIGRDILEGQLFVGDEERKLNAMNFEDAFAEVVKRGGFDVVIGNPPYLASYSRESVQMNRIEKVYFGSHYKTISGRVNTFVMFVERGVDLLREGGRLGFIVPKPFLMMTAYTGMRDFLLSHQIEKIVLCGEEVFPDATVPSSILIATKKSETGTRVPVEVWKFESEAQVSILRSISYDQILKDAERRIKAELDQAAAAVLSKAVQMGTPLGALAKVEDGINPGPFREVLVSDKKSGATFVQMIEGRNFSRYSPVVWGGKFFNWDKNLLKRIQPKHPNSVAVLGDQRRFLADEKIVTRQTAAGIMATLETNKFYSTNSVHTTRLLHSESSLSTKYLLGLLNSRLLDFFFRLSFKEKEGAFPQVKVKKLRTVPIRVPDFAKPSEKLGHDRMVILVEAMLEAKKQLAEVRTDKDKTYYENKCSSLDRQIDRLVYDLYGLTEEEIRIVEETSVQ